MMIDLLWWVIKLLPNATFELLMLGSIVGLVLSLFFGYIPFVNQFKTPIQAISIGVLVFTIYSEGVIGSLEKTKHQTEMLQLQNKISQLEAKSSEANVRVVQKYITIHDSNGEKTNEITKEITKYVHDDCTLSNDAVRLHDVSVSAAGEVPGSTFTSDGGTSSIKVPELLTTVNENYGTYHEVVARLKAWQDWYKEQKKLFEESHK